MTENINDFLQKLTSGKDISENQVGIIRDVCNAEREAQALKLQVQDARAPLSYLALIVIIFAGPLGDKFNRRKPFLLLPMVGELLSVIGLIVSRSL